MKQYIEYHPPGEWIGRSLRNYIDIHPKAKGAKTLTEARRMAFGSKPKRFHTSQCASGCKCK